MGEPESTSCAKGDSMAVTVGPCRVLESGWRRLVPVRAC